MGEDLEIRIASFLIYLLFIGGIGASVSVLQSKEVHWGKKIPIALTLGAAYFFFFLFARYGPSEAGVFGIAYPVTGGFAGALSLALARQQLADRTLRASPDLWWLLAITTAAHIVFWFGPGELPE